jgi:hypothetical protein
MHSLKIVVLRGEIKKSYLMHKYMEIMGFHIPKFTFLQTFVNGTNIIGWGLQSLYYIHHRYLLLCCENVRSSWHMKDFLPIL